MTRAAGKMSTCALKHKHHVITNKGGTSWVCRNNDAQPACMYVWFYPRTMCTTNNARPRGQGNVASRNWSPISLTFNRPRDTHIDSPDHDHPLTYLSDPRAVTQIRLGKPRCVVWCIRFQPGCSLYVLFYFWAWVPYKKSLSMPWYAFQHAAYILPMHKSHARLFLVWLARSIRRWSGSFHEYIQ